MVALFLVGCTSRQASPTWDAGIVCATDLVVKSPLRDKIDLLFVIDDSPAMASMETRLGEQLPTFMDALVDAATNQLPNLHVGVVPTSMGAGRYSNVPGCQPGGPGDGGGRLVHPAAAGLTGGDAFMRADGSPLNLTLPARETFAALGRLGHGGCRFPQPLAAARRALEKARNPSDPDNAGFLRDDARLAVVIVTNGDDCSVPVDSDLFDPAQTRLSDPYGALAPYRCAEFGLLCQGHSPPHEVPLDGAALNACVPAGPTGPLTPIEELSVWLRTLKANPDDVLVSVIGGPTEAVAVRARAVELADGTVESQPELAPSCTALTIDDTATPAVRLHAWADQFGPNGIFYPACGPSLVKALESVAEHIHIRPTTPCIPGTIVSNPDGQPICAASQNATDERGLLVQTKVPACDDDRTLLPCWRPIIDQVFCWPPGGTEIRICRDTACNGLTATSAPTTVRIECQVTCSSPGAGRTYIQS